MAETNDDLLFVYRDDRDNACYDYRDDEKVTTFLATVVILPYLPGPSIHTERSAWVMSDNPFAIRWRYYRSLEHSQYGPSSDDSDLVLKAIQQETQIDLIHSQPLPPTPFYVSANKDRKPTTYAVVVRFHFDTVDFLPRVQSDLARDGWIAKPSDAAVESALKEWENAIQSWKEKKDREDAQRGWITRWLRRLWRLAFGSKEKEDDSRCSKKFLILSHSTEPFPGLFLPVFLTGIELPGVLQIKEAQGQRTISAILYLCDTLGDVQMPIELVSKHRKRQGDQFHVVEKVIGSIVAIT
jgi:hypothetical protein